MRTPLSGWGRYPVGISEVHRPERLGELKVPLQSSGSAIARGLGRSYGDASFNSSGCTVLTERLNRFLDFDPSTGALECEAGVTIGEILEYFIPRGFVPPVIPGTKFVTLGGALACDIHGKNHHKDGSFGRHVIDFSLLTADGELVHCSRDENVELFRATVGGMGLTGIITQLRLRLIPIEDPRVVVDYDRAKDLDRALELFHESDERYKYSVAWIDCVGGGRRGLGRSVLMRGNPATGSEAAVLRPEKRRGISVPSTAPSFLLNRGSIRAFNGLYYRKHPRQARGVLSGYESFFFPLDGIRNWNRLYGRSGFFQYQAVLPYDDGRDGLVKMLELLRKSGPGAFLAVLKRFGSGNPEAPLSFPMPGYTLAADVPRRGSAVLDLLSRLDEIVIDLGGRVYLAKDARTSPGAVRAMYPHLESWLEIKSRFDPANRLGSDLARRLELLP
ncbi:MAG: FAD-binding oxidoreductase [Gemmatimonadota bacterium]|nr:MAG: FAD-binding oxidoreductase [Gemmatimonadota bacterium]